MRTVLVALTILGGLLSLMAAFIVAWQSIRARLHERDLHRLDEWLSSRVTEHDTKYMAWNEADWSHKQGQGPDPGPPPFGGLDMNQHADQVNGEYARRYLELTGRKVGEPVPEGKSLRDEIFARLLGPAVLAASGTVVSTIAGACSLYVT